MEFNVGENDKLAIFGNNGSGKSTLLQVILGSKMPSEGEVIFKLGQTIIEQEEVFKYCSIAAPYLELFEELSLRENIEFQARFKSFIAGITPNIILEVSGLELVADRPLKQFSSGMKQRAKLALALLADTFVVLLDEPCSNLDAEGINWYKKMVSEYSKNRIVIVSSNADMDEAGFCKKNIDIRDFKK